MEVEISTSLRGKDVIIFSSSARNEAGLDINKAKLELYGCNNFFRAKRRERWYSEDIFQGREYL